jgi:hypothetical protein
MRVSPLRGACMGGVLAFVASCTTHRTPPPSADIDETGFRNDVRLLASDDFEGRKPGTPGEDKTVAFLVGEFKKLGLKPGNGDSYVQPVPLVEITPVSPPSLSVTGRDGRKALNFTKDMVIWSQRFAPQASLQQSELVFVGSGRRPRIDKY